MSRCYETKASPGVEFLHSNAKRKRNVELSGRSGELKWINLNFPLQTTFQDCNPELFLHLSVCLCVSNKEITNSHNPVNSSIKPPNSFWTNFPTCNAACACMDGWRGVSFYRGWRQEEATEGTLIHPSPGRFRDSVVKRRGGCSTI